MTDFVYGTQYYRAPTPLPEEWENDFKNFSRYGINTIQLRLQWRQHEKRRGEYDFSDSDRLFDLAEKYQIKVIVKFMLENAPDYVFYELNGRRIGLNGIPLTEGAHGAFYIGGWRPCFDNPDVMQSALRFVEKTVTRYRNKQVLLYWNIWNEPRSKPIGDCCCEHSTELYRRYVAEKFGTYTIIYQDLLQNQLNLTNLIKRSNKNVVLLQGLQTHQREKQSSEADSCL